MPSKKQMQEKLARKIKKVAKDNPEFSHSQKVAVALAYLRKQHPYAKTYQQKN